MSLQVLAQDMASRGRGPDSMLVHMAPGEVAGLQALARAHGGTLTTNPETGLPEAGFLASILPMIAGAALGPAGLGLTAMQAGLAAGALGTVATGSLRKGLMAGLGAYGGAGLIGSVTGAGEAALNAANATSPTVGPMAAPVAAPAVGGADLYADLAQSHAFMPEPAFSVGAPTAGSQAGMAQGVVLDSTTPVRPQPIVGPRGEHLGYEPVTPPPAPVVATPAASAAPDLGQYANPKDRFLQQGTVESPAYARKFSVGEKAKAGLKAIYEKPDLLLNKQNLRYGLAAAAPLMFQEPKSANAPSDTEQYRYAYNPGRVANPELMYTGAPSGERTYFRPSFTRMAEGGVADSEETAQYTYNPVTQQYAPVVKTVTQMPTLPPSAGGGGGGDSAQQQSAWSQMTPTQQAAYYAANPTMAAITQMGQKGFGMTTPGMVQKAFAPDFVRDQQMIAQGIDPVTGVSVFGAASPAELAGITAAMNMQGVTAQGLATQGLGIGYDPSIFGAAESTYAGPAVTGYQYSGNDSMDFGPAPDSGPSTSDNNTGGGGTNTTDTSDPGFGAARGGLMALAGGGMSHLGDYSDGGRLLKGPGDGVSDSIPATIADKQPARLADGEFVVPARIVSELGNGSTEAGARKLYAMMDRIQKNRAKSVGKGKVAINSRSEKLLPA